jgi:hypothetical protein
VEFRWLVLSRTSEMLARVRDIKKDMSPTLAIARLWSKRTFQARAGKFRQHRWTPQRMRLNVWNISHRVDAARHY